MITIRSLPDNIGCGQGRIVFLLNVGIALALESGGDAGSLRKPKPGVGALKVAETLAVAVVEDGIKAEGIATRIGFRDAAMAAPQNAIIRTRSTVANCLATIPCTA